MTEAQTREKPNRHLRAEIARHWEQLTASDLDECCDDSIRLIDILQRRYGFVKRRAIQEAEAFFREFEERLRMAA